MKSIYEDMKKILDEYCYIRDKAINLSLDPSYKPKIAVYLSFNFYNRLLDELDECTPVSRQTFIEDKTMFGCDVYVVADFVNEHPDYQLVRLDS